MATELSISSSAPARRIGDDHIAAQIAALFAGADVGQPLFDCSPDELVTWCKRNKVPLLALAAELPPALAASPHFARALADECVAFEMQHQEYLQVREAWLSRGISCLLIKPADEHPSFPHMSDNIDILVRPEHGLSARNTLRELGYVEVRSVEEPQKHLFRKFHDGTSVSAIHVHERIAWFVEFLDDAAVWRRARSASDDPLVTIPSNEDVILINLAHACYENKLLRLNDVLRVRTSLLAAGSELDWAYMEEVATRRGWRDGWAFMLLVYADVETALFGATLIPLSRRNLLETIVRESPSIWKRLEAIRASELADLPLDLSYLFCKRLYYRKIFSDQTRGRGDRWRDVAATLIWGVRLKSKLRPQAGYVVSLSGVDGSGKTSHATTLVEALRLCELKADYRWSRGGSTGLAAVVSRLRHRSRRGAPAEAASADVLDRRRQEFVHPARRIAWSWLVAFDQVARSYRNAAASRLRGRIIVEDRSLYDTAVEMNASLPAGARWSQAALAFMLACGRHSDLGYVLDVSSATARKRKPDEAWHSGYDAERQQYRLLADQFGLTVLSNDGAFAEASDPLILDVMLAYMAHYETRLNALFYANPSQKNAPDPIWAKRATR